VTTHATLIDGATFLAVQRHANAHPSDDVDEQLRDAGIDAAAAQREAAFVADLYSAYGIVDRAAVTAAFLSGLEIGARCARLVP